MRSSREPPGHHGAASAGPRSGAAHGCAKPAQSPPPNAPTRSGRHLARQRGAELEHHEPSERGEDSKRAVRRAPAESQHVLQGKKAQRPPGTHQRAREREPQNRAGAQAAQSGPRSGADFERAIRKVAAHQSTGACPKHASASKDRPTFHVKHHGRPPHLRASPRLEGPPPSPPRSPRTPRRAQASSSSGRGPRDAR